MGVIEIITEDVKMPKPEKRRYIKGCPSGNPNGKSWNAFDTETGNVIYRGTFENVTLACHNLNKKYYKECSVTSDNSESALCYHEKLELTDGDCLKCRKCGSEVNY